MKKTNRRNFLKTLTGLLAVPTSLCLAKPKQNKTQKKKYNRFIGMATGISKTETERNKIISNAIQCMLKGCNVLEKTSGEIIIHYYKTDCSLGNYAYHITHDIEDKIY